MTLDSSRRHAFQIKGNADADYQAATQHLTGQGVVKDSTKAFEGFLRAARQGDAEALFQVGSAYAFGEGIPQDISQAGVWWQKAAEAYERKAEETGAAEAQFKTGLLYARGRGVMKDRAKAYSWYLKAAEQGHAIAQFEVAWAYAEGLGVEEDPLLAAAWWRKAASSEEFSGDILLALAGCYKGLDRIKYDPNKIPAEELPEFLDVLSGLAACRRSARIGDLDALYKLGYCYLHRWFPDHLQNEFDSFFARHSWEQHLQFDPFYCHSFCGPYFEGEYENSEEYVKFSVCTEPIKIAAEKGHSGAQWVLGWLNGNHPESWRNAEAMAWFRKAAEGGDSLAQWDLGRRLLGVDDHEATVWLKEAVDQGSEWACFDLAKCYLEGKGVPEDADAAEALLKEASSDTSNWYFLEEELEFYYKYCHAIRGDAEAQSDVGYGYDAGEFLLEDDELAVKWNLKAALQGHAVSQCSMGCYYSWGKGVPMDKAEAAKWFLAAASLGNQDAQWELAQCYSKGEGVQVDKSEALGWLQKAANQGHELAKSELLNRP